MKLWIENNELKKKNRELLRLLKAIIKQYYLGEVIISDLDLKEMDRYDIYETEQYMSMGKRYQVIDKYKNRTEEK